MTSFCCFVRKFHCLKIRLEALKLGLEGKKIESKSGRKKNLRKKNDLNLIK